MSTQELDLRRSWGIIRRYRRVVIAAAAVGLGAGIAVGYVTPPMHTATALVVLQLPHSEETETRPPDINTQVLIANSTPVLQNAGQNLDPTLTVREIEDRVRVSAATQDIVRIRAQGPTEREAIDLANAVADTYVFYVTNPDSDLPGDLGRLSGTRVLERPTSAEGGPLAMHLAIFGGIGGAGTTAIAAIVMLAIGRGDRRLRYRDDIADAVGIPVVASVSALHPRDVSEWGELLDHYEPSAVDAWSLRKILHRLGLDGKWRAPVSVVVASFAEDPKALAFGPQFAAFASSIGIPTTLVVATRHESAASLLAGATASVSHARAAARPLTRSVAHTDDLDADPESVLHVVVVVVDRERPLLDHAIDGTTVVAVSSGTVTAEELARLAVSAADDHRTIDGIVVVDPEPTDRTTGRAPQASRRKRGPTQLADTARGGT